MSSFQSLIHLLRDRAQTQPEDVAFTFLQDGEVEAGHLTYQMLDQQARAIAQKLQSIASVGDRAILLYPFNANLEFIAALFGCFYAGVIAVPTKPPQKADEWIDCSIRIQDCQTQIILTTASLADKLQAAWLEEFAQSLPQDSDQLSWIATDRIPIEGSGHWQPVDVDADAIAYLQYTSGSTGIPKGVVITHGNVLHNCMSFQQTFPNFQFRGLNWLPLTHDMGLVAGIMQTLYAGAQTFLMSPIAVFQNPNRWIQAISTYKATISGGPNFIYDLCVQRVKPEHLTDLDLSHWEIAGNGAEPVRPETLERFAAMFEPYGFQHQSFYLSYGMAEATLVISGGVPQQTSDIQFLAPQALEQNRVTWASVNEPSAKPAVSCGKPWFGNQAVIVDPKTLRRCPPDGVGEIWVQGAGLSRMYWNRPQETEQTFRAYLADTGEGPFLRTGDLGFLQDGELFITGRHKDIMIFWGRNFYPQTLEQTTEKSHPSLLSNGTAAFSVEIEGEERLVIAQEIERAALRQLTPTLIEDMIGAIRQSIVMEHLVDVYAIALLKPSSLPKTTSGKVQRHRCREQFLANALPSIYQWICSDSERLDPSDLARLPGIEDA